MHRTAVLTLSVALTACSGGITDPTASLLARRARPAQLADASATFNQLQAISAVTSTPLFESFSVLAPRFALTTLSLELAARYAPWHRSSPPVPLSALRRGGTTDPHSFPLSTKWRGGQGVRTGTTFVWDPTTNAYVASSDSGAPANGERFLLYALSQRTGLPSVPLTSTGYVDLTDTSTGATGVTLVGAPAAAPPATYASYTVARGGSTLAGFVTDGTTRLDLNVRADSTTTAGALDVQTALAVAGQDLRVSESVSVSRLGGDTVRMTTDLRVASSGETVRAAGDVTLDTTTHSGAGRMTVSVSDAGFATITLGGPDLAFTPAPGVTLTAADETTLRALFSTSFELFGTVRFLLSAAGRG